MTNIKVQSFMIYIIPKLLCWITSHLVISKVKFTEEPKYDVKIRGSYQKFKVWYTF